jgi:hypothetical protein
MQGIERFSNLHEQMIFDSMDSIESRVSENRDRAVIAFQIQIFWCIEREQFSFLAFSRVPEDKLCHAEAINSYFIPNDKIAVHKKKKNFT